MEVIFWLVSYETKGDLELKVEFELPTSSYSGWVETYMNKIDPKCKHFQLRECLQIYVCEISIFLLDPQFQRYFQEVCSNP